MKKFLQYFLGTIFFLALLYLGTLVMSNSYELKKPELGWNGFKAVVASLILSKDAYAYEDCSKLINNYNQSVFSGPYQECRIANALEVIAQKMS